MINLIKSELKQILENLNSGTSYISELDQLKLIKVLQSISNQELSKLESANYLGISRATFDNYIKKGILPKGHKRQGFKELSWYKKDLHL